MRILPNHLVRLLCCAALLTSTAGAATKVHVIMFGKWTSAQWFPGGTDDKAVIIKIRALVIDGRIKEYVLGAPHEVTERLFVVRRVFRVNDSLPEDTAPRWQWQRGGWLLVDRATGHISPINLPEFDAYYSAASWYRDYVAYCGVADDGKNLCDGGATEPSQAGVEEGAVERRVPEDTAPDSACPLPSWQRNPVRVSFEPAGSAKQIFAIRGHVVDLVNDAEEEEEGSK